MNVPAKEYRLEYRLPGLADEEIEIVEGATAR
jgi:hypothetical protein